MSATIIAADQRRRQTGFLSARSIQKSVETEPAVTQVKAKEPKRERTNAHVDVARAHGL